MSYIYEALSPGGHQEMLEEVFSKVREQVGSYKTASGSLVSFTDGADLPMPSFVCNIDAVQDLHGYDSPWVGGARKNKLPMTVDGIKAANTAGTWSGNSYTANGVTFKIQTDYDSNVIGITVDTNGGTASADVIFYLSADSNRGFSLLQGTSYIVTADGTTNNVGVRIGDSTDAYVGMVKTNPLTFTADSSNTARIGVNNGLSISNITIKPMIRLSTETDATFAPYSNICPISGHTVVDAWVRGKNLFNDALMVSPTTSAKWVQVQLKPNTTYTVSSNIPNSYTSAYIFAIAGTDVSGVTSRVNGVGQNRPQKITTGADGILSFGYRTSGQSGALDLDDYYYQIELGETATTYEPYNPQSQTIQVSWQTEAGEVFGGYVDLVSGELVVTHRIVNCKNLYFVSGVSAGGLNYADISISVGNTPISNKLKYVEKNDGWASTAFCVSVNNENKVRVYGRLSDFADGGSYENTMVRYELATPQTYQLTPTQIKSLLGNNNAWCSTGDIKSLQYQPNNIIAELRDEILALQARVEELEQTE